MSKLVHNIHIDLRVVADMEKIGELASKEIVEQVILREVTNIFDLTVSTVEDKAIRSDWEVVE